jgi:P4 family phage/plasmid primase-like protien
MENKMYEFLLSKKKAVNGQSVIVSQDEPFGNFNISRKDQEEFWKLYCDLLQNGVHLSLAERPDNVCPILNDTDIKVQYDPEYHSFDEKVYDESHLRNVVKSYQKQLKTKFSNYEPKHSICFVLEKDKPVLNDAKNVLNNGFHLHFIYSFLKKCDIEEVVLKSVRKEIDEMDLFSDIGIVNSGGCIDNITSKYWLLYGSTKKSCKQYYKVTKIYDENLNEITLEQALSEFKLYNTEGDEIKLNKDNYHYYLPRIMSISSENKEILKLKPEYEGISKRELKPINSIKKKIDNIPVQQLLKTARDLMKIISVSRADNYNDWMEIGWILHYISEGSMEGFDLWNDFSSKTSKRNSYSETECLYQWNKMKDKHINPKTIASLYYFAKVDSPEEYKKIQTKKNEALIQNAFLNKGHYSLAMWLYEQYKDEFVCASIEKNIWYQYKGHRWNLTSQGIELKKKISNHLRNEVMQFRQKVCIEMSKASEQYNYSNEDEEEEDNGNNRQKAKNPEKELQDELKAVNCLLGKLEENSFKNGIMKECQELFYKDDFFNKLDQDIYLLHFTNGILDLKDLCFRPGKQTDYISLTTGYDFKEDYSHDDLEIMEALDHLDKTFPNKELREYFIEYCASLLKGGNFNKTFVVMTGSGDNGKSVNIDMIYNILGDYAKPLPTSLIFGKRTQSSGATPELACINGIRFAALQESNEKDTINNGILKELTGNDKISVRALFKEQTTFKPQLKLCLICNKLPKITADDPATWDRLRVLPYEASFPKDQSKVPKSPFEQKQKGIFPRDPTMDEKIKNLKQGFMWIFYERFKHIQKHGKMEDPPRVTEATSKYRVRNDHYGSFLIERMVSIPENQRTKQFITFDTIYKAFQEWYIDTYPGSSIPSKLDTFEEIKKKLKLDKDVTMSRTRINTHRLKTTAEIQGDIQDESLPQFGRMSIDDDKNKSDEDVEEEQDDEI